MLSMLLNFIKMVAAFSLLMPLLGCSSLGSNNSGLTGLEEVPEFDYAAVENIKISGAEVVFTEMMVPHHEQALVLAELAYQYAEDERIIALAREIDSTQEFEVGLMNRWLDASGTVEKNQLHSEMKGMLSPDDFERLEGLRGNEFDVAWLEYMIEHHEGAVLMVDILRFATTEGVIAFGQYLVEVQSAEIRFMEGLLEEIR